MLGAAVYILRANNSATIPAYHGRLAHAAFLSALREVTPQVATYLHETQPQKPFTVAELFFSAKHTQKSSKQKFISVEQDTLATWRITGLNETFMPYLTSLTPGKIIRFNKLLLSIEKCCFSPDEHDDSGLISKSDLLAACFNVPQVEKISFSFLSPTTFRFFDCDYPLPLPSYVFGSLAEKWQQNDTTNLLPLDKSAIRDAAAALFPEEWQGKSCVLPVTENRYIHSFTGNFTYNTTKLSREQQQIFLLLAQFATFAGVGRLTGQGLGQTKMIYA